MKKTFLYLSIVLSCMTVSCKKDFNPFFSLDQERQLGLQIADEIAANPTEYPILDSSSNVAAYKYVWDIMNTVLNSKEVNHKNDFKWRVTIINKDVLNAFAAPGGQLYFYTGFLKYATSEAEFAGVMAHEIAHSDRRHSTESMTKQQGIAFLLDIVAGKNASGLTQIVSSIAQTGAALQFSRKHEYEADEYSVRYLVSIANANRTYDPTAIVDFFDQMKADSLSQPNGKFEFLRTHPYDDNRKENIMKVWQKLGSPAGQKYESQYAQFKALLP
ncbi:MAG: M48 family metalloprotease [Bacteroidetes bacterium]|nr:M48 family metalloprotease [Bacteroidota bacterium]